MITAIEALLGFLAAAVFSAIALIVCQYIPRILDLITPILVVSQILPLITLAPIFIIVFGMGISSKIAMVALMAFFPIFINFSAAATSASRRVNELLFVYGARPTFSIFKVILPLTVPQGFAGLRVSTTMAVMGAIVAEFMGAQDGLGKNLYLAPKSSQPELMICSVVLVSLLGIIFYGSVLLAEKLLCHWNTP